MIELEKAPMPNPPIELEQDPWWWKVVGRKATGHRLTTMSDGGKVQYKYHIALDPATFITGPNKEQSRTIVVNFLVANGIPFKCGGSDSPDVYMKPGGQHGKMFTIYAETEEQFYIVAKGMQELVKKYKLTGIPLAEIIAGGGNQQYEKVVPNTNNTLYYTIEAADATALINAGAFTEADRPGLEFLHGKIYPDVAYLGGGSNSVTKGYSQRIKVVEHYMGEGPIDFLF
jgi:hypothetical protein